MKNLNFLFFFAILITSCSDDSGTTKSGPQGTGILIRSTTVISGEEGSISGSTMEYDGFKLKIRTKNGVDEKYTYDGDLITKVEYFYHHNGALYATTSFEYSVDGKLTRVHGGEYTHYYTYNADGTISVNVYFGDIVSPEYHFFDLKLFLTDGEITRIEKYPDPIYFTSPGSANVEVLEMTYDNQKNVYGNIVGYNKIYWQTIGRLESSGNMHNLLTQRLTGSSIYTYNRTYSDYNDKGYPTKAVDNSLEYMGYPPATIDYYYW